MRNSLEGGRQNLRLNRTIRHQFDINVSLAVEIWEGKCVSTKKYCKTYRIVDDWLPPWEA